MVFGRKSALALSSMKWAPHYAWVPVPLMDGRWAWLQEVERISYFAPEIPIIRGWWRFWCYRLPGDGQ